MKDLYQCESCGHLSTCGGEFKGITASNGADVLVCAHCAVAYGSDKDVAAWINEAAHRDCQEQGEELAA